MCIATIREEERGTSSDDKIDKCMSVSADERFRSDVSRACPSSLLLLSSFPECALRVIAFTGDRIRAQSLIQPRSRALGMTKLSGKVGRPFSLWVGTACDNREPANEKEEEAVGFPASLRVLFFSCYRRGRKSWIEPPSFWAAWGFLSDCVK